MLSWGGEEFWLLLLLTGSAHPCNAAETVVKRANVAESCGDRAARLSNIIVKATLAQGKCHSTCSEVRECLLAIGKTARTFRQRHVRVRHLGGLTVVYARKRETFRQAESTPSRRRGERCYSGAAGFRIGGVIEASFVRRTGADRCPALSEIQSNCVICPCAIAARRRLHR